MDTNIHCSRQDIFSPYSNLYSIQKEADFIVGKETSSNVWIPKLLEHE
jgi:hypothetical protein